MYIAEVIALVVAGLPLLLYPFVMIANIMSIAGEHQADAGLFVTVSGFSFMLATTLYPVVYLYAVASYIVRRKKQNYKKSRRSLWLMYGYLVLVIILGGLWMLADG